MKNSISIIGIQRVAIAVIIIFVLDVWIYPHTTDIIGCISNITSGATAGIFGVFIFKRIKRNQLKK